MAERPDDGVTTGLGIAAGIETALTLARVFTPAWSTIDAGDLAAFTVLPGLEALTIVADHDATARSTTANAPVAYPALWKCCRFAGVCDQ